MSGSGIPQPRQPHRVQAELLALVPDGWAATRDPDDYGGAIFLPAATEFSLIEASALSLLPQIDPRQAPQLLADWERMLGPDPCQVASQVNDSVAAGLVAFGRLTNAGTICAGYFERYALSIGETITIAEFPGYQLGAVQCGGNELVQPSEACSFQVSLPATNVTQWQCGASCCGDSLGSFSPSVMQCMIANGAPLYAQPYFKYS